MLDEDIEELTLFTFYKAPRGAIPRAWKATPDTLAKLLPYLQMLDGISFNGVDDTLKVLRGTELRALIPAPPKAGAISAVRLSRRKTGDMSSTLPAGPWAAAFPDLIDLLAQKINEALEDENPTLLIIRELDYPGPPAKRPPKKTRRVTRPPKPRGG